MGILIHGSIFVAVCLAIGLGIFMAFEEVRNLQGRHTAIAARDAAVVVAGVLMALAAGGYWLSMALP